MVKMHMNAKKSQDFDFFNIHPSHSDYMSATEDNFIYVKNKHVNDPKAFKSIVDSQSFLKDKAEIARQCDIEQLYKGIFSQTSATVHVADLSDRMDTYVEEETEFYTYKLGSHNESTMIGGTANILLVKALVDFSRFFQIKPSKKIDRLTKSILKHN